MSDDADRTSTILMNTGFYSPNKFSQFKGRFPSPTYAGTPTDAQGNPIATPQGMTLNTPPPAAAKPAATSSGPQTLQQLYGSEPGASAMNPSGNGAMMWNTWGGLTGPSGIMANDAAMRGQAPGMNGLMNPAYNPGGAAASAPQPSAPPGNDFNTALTMLANPGHVSTPGANVPQMGLGAFTPTPYTPPPPPAVPMTINTPPPAAAPAANQFLASQASSGQKPGQFSNQGFFDTLNALKSGGQPKTSSLAPTPATNLKSAFAPVSMPGLGGLGGMGGMAPGTAWGTATSNPNFMQEWRGMGSGNGGAAGNGSVGGV